jgi:hypothetical protein
MTDGVNFDSRMPFGRRVLRPSRRTRATQRNDFWTINHSIERKLD